MKQFIVALVTLAVCGVAVAQPSFGFTENDYRGLESAGVLRATVRRSGSQNGIIVVNVRTMTKLQYLALGFSLVGFPSLDPAELNDTNFGDDFTMTDVNITFPDNSIDRINVDIPITNDNVDEVEEEGFIIVMNVVEFEQGDNNFQIGRNVTVGLIEDDDDLIVTFEIPSLTVSEAQGSLELFVTKQDGMLSERIVDVNIDAFSHNATYDLDFSSPNGQTETLIFSSTDARLPITTMIIDDALVEGVEHYSIDLIISPNNDYVLGRHPRVLIFIKDNDEPPTPEPTPTPEPSSTPTTPPTGATTPEVDCPDDDVAIGITFLITFLLTLLFASILWAIICALCLSWDRKRRAKAVAFGALEQQQMEQQQTQH